MKYRAALIGCGKIGSLYANDPKIKGIYTHAGAYSACEKTELVAVCDIDPVKSHACATQWKVKNHYTNLKKLLDEQKPEIVSICTINETHADILHILLKTPGIKGIIVEKPLALDVMEASKLVKIAKEKEIIIVVNYNRRYANGHQKIKQCIENGDIGSIQKITGYYTKGIFHNGTHWLDLARWLIGEIKVMQGVNKNNAMHSDPELDVWMEFENGASGFLQNVDAKAYSLFEMDIVGTDGRIRITDSGHTIDFYGVVESPHYTGYKTIKKQMTMNDSVSDTVLNALEDLIVSIENKKTPICSVDDGLAVLSIASALKPMTVITN